MTTILLSLEPVPMEVTYDSAGLFVGLKIYVFSSGSWVQLGSTLPVPAAGSNNTYGIVYTPPHDASFIAEMAVYTDGSYLTRNEDFMPSSRSFRFEECSGGGSTVIESCMISLKGLIFTETLMGKIPKANLIGKLSVEENIVC